MKYQKHLTLFLDQFYKLRTESLDLLPYLFIYFCIFFADLITLVIPATTPTKKNIKINHGLVPKVLSKINPIIVPTATADISSVLSLKAVPIGDGLCFLLSISLLEIFFFCNF